MIFISKLEECGSNWNCHHSVIENRAVTLLTTSLPFKQYNNFYIEIRRIENRAFIFFLFSRDSNFLINGFKENSKIKFRGNKKKKKI